MSLKKQELRSKTRAEVSKGNFFCLQLVRVVVNGVARECLQQRFALIEAIANIIFVFVVDSSSALK